MHRDTSGRLSPHTPTIREAPGDVGRKGARQGTRALNRRLYRGVGRYWKLIDEHQRNGNGGHHPVRCLKRVFYCATQLRRGESRGSKIKIKDQNKMNRICGCFIAILAMLALTETAANAAFLTVDFTATVTGVTNISSIAIGDTVTGSYTYELPGPVDSVPSDPNVGQYEFSGLTEQLEFTVGPLTDTVPLKAINIRNDSGGVLDQYNVISEEFRLPEFVRTMLTLVEFDNLRDPLLNDKLPVIAPNLNEFFSNTFRYDVYAEINVLNPRIAQSFISSLTSLSYRTTEVPTEVPEPITAVLLGGALVAGVARKRRSRS